MPIVTKTVAGAGAVADSAQILHTVSDGLTGDIQLIVAGATGGATVQVKKLDENGASINVPDFKAVDAEVSLNLRVYSGTYFVAVSSQGAGSAFTYELRTK